MITLTKRTYALRLTDDDMNIIFRHGKTRFMFFLTELSNDQDKRDADIFLCLTDALEVERTLGRKRK